MKEGRGHRREGIALKSGKGRLLENSEKYYPKRQEGVARTPNIGGILKPRAIRRQSKAIKKHLGGVQLRAGTEPAMGAGWQKG